MVEPPLKCTRNPAFTAYVPRSALGPVCAGGKLPESDLPKAWEWWRQLGADLELRDSCSQVDGTGRAFAFPQCSEMATARGLFTGDATEPGFDPDDLLLPDGGVTHRLHDGDAVGGLCPTEMGIIDITEPDSRPTPFDLRLVRDISDGGALELEDGGRAFEWSRGMLGLEWNWCRHYSGNLELPADFSDAGVNIYPPRQLGFSPLTGDEVAVVGEWITDMVTKASRNHLEPGGHAEIHEVWMWAARATQGPSDGGGSLNSDGTLRPVPGTGYGRAYDFRVSAQFPRDTGELKIRARVPPRHPDEADAGLTTFDCRQLQPLAGGCDRGGLVVVTQNFSDVTAEAGGNLEVTVRLPPSGPARDSLLNPHDCSKWQCAGACDGMTLACFNELHAQSGGCGAPAGGRPAFSGVIRCAWRDPQDLWLCGNCGCDDPATGYATRLSAPVTGCASAGLDPASAADRAQACSEVCGGLVCGDAPACRISQCRPPASAPLESARLLARGACTPPPPLRRVAPVGDYRVDLTPASLLRFGFTNDAGQLDSFVEVGRTSVSGFGYVNTVPLSTAAGPFADLGYLELTGAPFVAMVPSETFPHVPLPRFVTEESAVLLVRARAGLTGPTTYTFTPGKLFLSASATIDGERGGTEVLSQGPVDLFFDPVLNTFALSGAGRQEDGLTVLFELTGTVTNHPPAAAAGPDRAVECSSAATTPVALDGTGSADPDPGDWVTHYQWFERVTLVEPGKPTDVFELDRAVGVGPVLSTAAALGEHRFLLHAYDTHRGSGRDEVKVQVVDTTPPEVAVASTVCLWPPNHEYARFTLGADVQASSSDRCDISPTLRIVSVQANEAPLATGSGNTTPDVAFGPTTACVRAERTGGGGGRGYSVTVEAADASGNKATRVFTVLVPHDRSSQPNCRKAEGLDALDETCRR